MSTLSLSFATTLCGASSLLKSVRVRIDQVRQADLQRKMEAEALRAGNSRTFFVLLIYFHSVLREADTDKRLLLLVAAETAIFMSTSQEGDGEIRAVEVRALR